MQFSFGLNIAVQHTGVEKGAWLKSWGPSKTLNSKSCGCVHEVLIIFKLSCESFISLHHRAEVNRLSHVLSPEMVWFLNVWIARSSLLTRWLCVSTSYILIFFSSRYFLSSFEATLLMMLKTVLKPLFVKYVIFSLNVATVDSSFGFYWCFKDGIGRPVVQHKKFCISFDWPYREFSCGFYVDCTVFWI